MTTNHPTTTIPTTANPTIPSSPVTDTFPTDTTDTLPTDTTDPRDARHGDALWDEYWAGVGNEDWQAARLLLELSGRVRRFYAAHLAVDLEPAFDDDGHQPPARRREVILDWESAAGCIGPGCIDTGHINAAGFSSTEARLARLVAAMTTGAPLDLASLTWMGSWSSQVWQVLCEWGTDGRLTTSERS